MKQLDFLIQLFERYKAILSTSCLMDLPEYDKCSKAHLMNLCDVAIAGIKDGSMHYGKLCRWLGFIQGVMIASGLITVDGERDFTRPIFKEHETTEKDLE